MSIFIVLDFLVFSHHFFSYFLSPGFAYSNSMRDFSELYPLVFLLNLLIFCYKILISGVLPGSLAFFLVASCFCVVDSGSYFMLLGISVVVFSHFLPLFRLPLFIIVIHFPGSSDGKVSAYNVGDLGSIPGWGRSSGGGNGNPLQYSCLENPMHRRAWWATVYEVAKSWT